MTSLDALSGKTLWTADHPPSGHYSPEDLLVAGGLVWAGAIAGGRDSGVFTGRDLHTGEIKSEFPPDVDIYWMHHRCHRSKATDRFLLPSRTGIEFVDFRSEHWQTHHWVRGGCIYGIMPANGLVYAPPHSCACYMDAKLNGFYALAPAEKAESGKRKADEPLESLRLERGPAYGQAPIHHSAFIIQHSHDWPAYRHDAARTGRTETPVPAKLKPAWEAALGGRPSSVVVAQGRLYVAEVDAHTVHALDAKSGELVWSFTAGGRVDSPPTIYHRLVLFGSADGWVYCLGAGDGALAWRFRAAPVDRRLVAFEQVESVWPVHGSVLVEGGVLYCVAGRSMFLDGGMRLLRLDPTTGRKLSETVLDDRDPATGENLQTYVTGQNMAAALPDVLSSDGRSVYMRTQSFDLEGTRRHVAPTDVSEQGGEGLHLFSAAGFLDDSWLHRAYWMYGKSIASGANGWFLAGRYVPGGRILAVGDEAVYGFGRKPQYFRWSTPLEYHLFAVDKRPEIVDATTGKPATPGRPEKCQLPGTRLAYRWSGEVPLQARAMVLAGDVLFLAGPPDVVDEEEVFAHGFASEVQPRLEEQVAALEGARGGLLWAVSAADGRRLAEYRLESLPTWDGMAAAAGRLYLSTTDGKVLCLAAR